DDVGQVGANREVPVQTDYAQRRAGDETTADPKKTAQNTDDKPDDDQINRADVRAGDGKKHILFRAVTDQPQQKRGHILEDDGLADHEQDGNAGIAVTMILFEALQPFP